MNPASVSQVLGELNGSPRYIGTINTAVAASSNFSNAIGPGEQLLVQADASCYVLGGTSGTADVTAANGVLLQSGQTFYLRLRTPRASLSILPETHIQVIPVSGTVNLKVWAME